jgi:hypothetical protein
MGVSGQLQALAALSHWAQEPVWTIWRRETSLALFVNRILGHMPQLIDRRAITKTVLTTKLPEKILHLGKFSILKKN